MKNGFLHPKKKINTPKSHLFMFEIISIKLYKTFWELRSKNQLAVSLRTIKLSSYFSFFQIKNHVL